MHLINDAKKRVEFQLNGISNFEFFKIYLELEQIFLFFFKLSNVQFFLNKRKTIFRSIF